MGNAFNVKCALYLFWISFVGNFQQMKLSMVQVRHQQLYNSGKYRLLEMYHESKTEILLLSRTYGVSLNRATSYYENHKKAFCIAL